MQFTIVFHFKIEFKRKKTKKPKKKHFLKIFPRKKKINITLMKRIKLLNKRKFFY